RFQIAGMVREGSQGGEDDRVGALRHVAHDRPEQSVLVAMVIVHRLARNPGLGGDEVDIGAGKALPAKHFGGGFEDAAALGGVAAWRERVGNDRGLHKKSYSAD